jgi:Nucleotidyl transferase AbiEii toxin, Type IV TA system
VKGETLMAIRYDSTRFTRDADFSTRERYSRSSELALLQAFDDQLMLANEQLSYDVMCRRQTMERRPPRADATFPTLNMSIGYAQRSKPRELQRLLSGQAPSVVDIEYSYNEAVLDAEVLKLSDGESLQVYSQINLMAEKLRAVLQQPVRQRHRRQDIYDLALLLRCRPMLDPADRARLLTCLRATAHARGIVPDVGALRDPKIKDMARKGYDDLQPEIEGVLPPFEEVYGLVQAFYEGLPWGRE